MTGDCQAEGNWAADNWAANFPPAEPQHVDSSLVDSRVPVSRAPPVPTAFGLAAADRGRFRWKRSELSFAQEQPQGVEAAKRSVAEQAVPRRSPESVLPAEPVPTEGVGTKLVTASASASEQPCRVASGLRSAAQPEEGPVPALRRPATDRFVLRGSRIRRSLCRATGYRIATFPADRANTAERRLTRPADLSRPKHGHRAGSPAPEQLSHRRRARFATDHHPTVPDRATDSGSAAVLPA